MTDLLARRRRDTRSRWDDREPQRIFNLHGADIGMDAAGNATLAVANSTGHVAIYTRGASASTFTNQGDLSTGLGTLGRVFLTVDPDGAAVVTWQQGDAIKQATRAAAAGALGQARRPLRIGPGRGSGGAALERGQARTADAASARLRL